MSVCVIFAAVSCSNEKKAENPQETVTEQVTEQKPEVFSDSMPSFDMTVLPQYSECIPAPDFSSESGFYENDVTLSISCDGSYEIRYTADGSTPTAESSLYTEALNITERSSHQNLLSSVTDTGPEDVQFQALKKVDKGTVIRAACFDSSGVSGPVVTNTYFVGLSQEDDYNSLPVISLVTDAGNLFNYEKGIYVSGKTYDEWKNTSEAASAESWEWVGNYRNKGREWERPVCMELMEPDGTLFEQNLGMRIMGKASRTYNQKSFRMYARDEYGSKKVEYPLIPGNLKENSDTEELNVYKTFLLRNGGNDCDYTKLRDPFIQETVKNLDFTTQSSRPAVVFINGEYWGVYAIEEDYSDSSIHYDYDIEKSDVIIIKCGELEEGEESDMELFEELCSCFEKDLSDAGNYAALCEMIDIQSVADLYSVLIYTANEDCIFNTNGNWRLWRSRSVTDTPYQDGKWRFMLYDTEFSLGLYKEGKTSTQDTLGIAEESPWFGALMKNDDFRKQFSESLLNVAELFKPDNSLPLLDRFNDKYQPVAGDCLLRFGPEWAVGSGSSSGATHHYIRNITLIENFLKERYDYITGLPGLN